ncbi:hypothetical protein PCE1_003539 [Barthelona sp. PCE]
MLNILHTTPTTLGHPWWQSKLAKKTKNSLTSHRTVVLRKSSLPARLVVLFCLLILFQTAASVPTNFTYSSARSFMPVSMVIGSKVHAISFYKRDIVDVISNQNVMVLSNHIAAPNAFQTNIAVNTPECYTYVRDTEGLVHFNASMVLRPAHMNFPYLPSYHYDYCYRNDYRVEEHFHFMLASNEGAISRAALTHSHDIEFDNNNTPYPYVIYQLGHQRYTYNYNEEDLYRSYYYNILSITKRAYQCYGLLSFRPSDWKLRRVFAPKTYRTWTGAYANSIVLSTFVTDTYTIFIWGSNYYLYVYPWSPTCTGRNMKYHIDDPVNYVCTEYFPLPVSSGRVFKSTAADFLTGNETLKVDNLDILYCWKTPSVSDDMSCMIWYRALTDERWLGEIFTPKEHSSDLTWVSTTTFGMKSIYDSAEKAWHVVFAYSQDNQVKIRVMHNDSDLKHLEYDHLITRTDFRES